MVQVPTTTPSTGYRNNILHISYCAAGVSRQGRRPEVIPAVSSFFPSLTLSSPPSLFVLSQLPLTPLSSFLGCPSLLRFLPFFSLFHPSLFCLLSVTPLPYTLSILGCPSLLLFPLLFLLSLFHPPLLFVFSQLSLPSPPRHPSILPSGLVSFPAPTAPSPEKMFRTCRTFRPKCHRSRKNPPD